LKFTKPTELKEIAFIAIPVLAIAGFLVDLRIPQGVDDWILYFIALALTIFLRNNYLPFVLSAVFTVLSFTGYYFSPAPARQMMIDPALLNLISGIAVMWVTATIIFFQQRLDREWRKSEARFSSLFKNMQAGFMHCQMIHEGGVPKDFVIESVNPAFEMITGLRRAAGNTMGTLIPGIWSDEPEILQVCNRVASTGTPGKFEMHLQTLNVWLDVSAYCPAKGHFAATLENITDRKIAEHSSALFRALIDRSSDGIQVVDPLTGCFRDVNEVTCRQLGYTRDELLSMHVSDVTPNVRHIVWADQMADLRRRRSLVVEGLHQRKDGTTFPTEASIRWVELEREYIIVVVRDISERKNAEEITRKSQEQLLSFVRQAPICIAMFDREMRYIIASSRWYAEHGYGQTNIIGRSHYEVCPDLPEAWKEVHRRALAGEIIKNDDDLWIKADGSKTWLRWSVHPWWDAKGHIGGVIISSENITERKLAEDAVRQSQDHLRMVTENARVGLVIVDRERRYTYANSAYFEILGLRPGKFIGRLVADELTPLYEEQIRPKLDAAFRGERVSYELHKPSPGGDCFFSVKYEPMKTGDVVSRVVVVITEITEQKRATEEIRKQLDELQRWHSVMVGREERILELKSEINKLLARQQKDRRYSVISA
jgi:PAS domain S-box-containing protein